MSDFDQIFQSASQQYGIDPNMLKAIAMKESSMNPQAVNPDGGAAGIMGFTADNAKAYGINPFKPEEAIPAAAKMFSESLARSGGDISQAVADHFAGPDPKLHGPKTAEYVQQVAAIFNGKQNAAPATQQGPSADDWLSGGAKQSAPAQASGPNVDDWLGKPVHEAPFTDETNNPNYKTPAGAMRIDVGGTDSSPTSASPPQNASIGSQLAHQVGLTGRAALTGLTGLPNMLGDAANSAINLGTSGINSLTGSNIPQLKMPSQATQDLMDQAGVAQPQNGTERVVQNVAGAMAGVSPSVAMGKLLAQSASPLTSAVGTGLQQLPGMQITGAAGAGTGAGLAQAAGAGPMGQLAAALGGGALGAIAPSGVTAAIRAPGAIIDNAVGAVQPVINPKAFVGKQLAQALGNDAQNVASNIRSIQEYVPGSRPTTAQAAPSPLLVATEKNEANATPAFKIALSQREADNNAARWKVIQSVAKSPEELTAAQNARDEAATPLYDAAHQEVTNVGKGFIQFARRPAVTQAMKQADTLAQNEGVALKWPTPDDRSISGHALDYTTRALGDMIGSAKTKGASQEVRALTDAQNYLKGWTEQYIPGVREAAQTYRDKSIPINTMEAGQQIANTLGTRALDSNGMPQIQLPAYKTALLQAMKAQKYGIDADSLGALQGVGQDLQRSTISNSLKSPGSDTAYNIAANGWLAKQLYGQDFGGASMLGRGMGALGATFTGHPMVGMGIMAGGKKLGQTVGNNLTEQLQHLLLNPEALLPYLDKAGKVTPKALAAALKNNMQQGLVGSAVTQP